MRDSGVVLGCCWRRHGGISILGFWLFEFFVQEGSPENRNRNRNRKCVSVCFTVCRKPLTNKDNQLITMDLSLMAKVFASGLLLPFKLETKSSKV